MERIQEQIVDPIEAPLQEHVQLHTAFQIVHVPVPQIQEIPQERLPERMRSKSCLNGLRSKSRTFLFLRSWKRQSIWCQFYLMSIFYLRWSTSRLRHQAVTDSLPNQPLPPAFTSFLERLTEQVVAAPSVQDVKEIIRATVNEPSTASDEARLKRVFDAALAERSAQELLAEEVATKPAASPATKKSKEGQTQKVSCGRCTSWHPPAQGGNINTGHFLPRGYGVHTHWRVTSPYSRRVTSPHSRTIVSPYSRRVTSPYSGWFLRPALQAAGYEDLLCRLLDTYVHHGELRYGTMGLIEFSVSAAAEREIVF